MLVRIVLADPAHRTSVKLLLAAMVSRIKMKLTQTVVVKHVENVEMEKFAMSLQNVLVTNAVRTFAKCVL